jgi:predicted metal-dependent peptidase
MTLHGTAEQKLVRARTQLLLNHPFFGTLCVRLKLAPGPVPTMATDGRRIVYNPRFVEKLKPAELEGVLAHEVLHCALAHHCRRGQREPGLWNRAADYAVNPILLASQVVLPAGVLVDPAFADLCAEEIYARLTKPPANGEAPDSGNTPPRAGAGASGPGPAVGNPSCDQEPSQMPHPGAVGEVTDAVGEDGKTASEAERQRQEREWGIAAEQALRSAKACGNEPGGVERALNELRSGQVDWRSVLRDFISASHPSDYSWTPPNRRHVSRGLYLPSVLRSGLGEIVIAVDTSGSIGTEELNQFAAEITAIADEVQPDRILVVYCDAALQGIQEFTPPEPVVLSPMGGGGTDFRPPFEWAELQRLTPACLIYLTDLCCRSYPDPPEYPVLWVTDSQRVAPFGETLRIAAGV